MASHDNLLWSKLRLFIILISFRHPSFQNPMVNQGQNHIDSPANMLQQQASFEVSAIIIQILSYQK